MTDAVPADLLDQLIDAGNKALNDHYHDDLCHCRQWPDGCVSRGGYYFGYWDTNAFAIAMPAIYRAIREHVAREIETHPGPIDGEWMDSRDRTAAASIARNGATQ
jgi:hypothetical protein